MSKRKINLSFNDIRKSFGELNQSHPFEFFLSFDHEVFKFKTKSQAQKFLNNFEINYNYYYFELIDLIPFLYKLNISSIHLKTDQRLTNFRSDLSFQLERSEDFLKNYKVISLPAREILNLFHLLDDQLLFYLKLYQKSNRNQYLLKSIKNNILSMNRLKKDLDFFLSDKSNLVAVPKKVLELKKHYLLRIA